MVEQQHGTPSSLLKVQKTKPSHHQKQETNKTLVRKLKIKTDRQTDIYIYIYMHGLYIYIIELRY